MDIKVNSEIGKLKKILLHRPGKEVERLYPEILERLLFDDIMDLEVAQQEHDEFASLLKSEGIEVFYVEKLVAETLDKHPETKEKFIRNFINEVIDNKVLSDQIYDFYNKIDNNLELVNAMIAGVKKSELKIDTKNDFDAMVLMDQDYPLLLDPIPNIIFQRDPIASIFTGMNVHNMSRPTRKREAHFYQYLFKYNEMFKGFKRHLLPDHVGTMEGGDILVINKETIFVGLSERTTAKAAEALSKHLFKNYPEFKRVIAIEIPKSHATMHLDTILTMMDHDKFAIDMEMYNLEYVSYVIEKDKLTKHESKISELISKYVVENPQFIVVGGGEEIRAKREQWNDGANSLTVRPGRVIAYKRNRITIGELKKAGIEVIGLSSSELSRGRGGPRCLSMPLEREDF